MKGGNVHDSVTAQRLGSPSKSIGYPFRHLDLAALRFTPKLKNNLSVITGEALMSGCCFFNG